MPSYANQTVWGFDSPIGLPGQIANEEKYNGISRAVETAAGLPFGHPGFRSATAANARNCRAYAASAKFLGISVLTSAYAAPQPGGTDIIDGYPQWSDATLMTEGTMYVTAGATVAPGDAVYWDPAALKYTNVTTSNFAIPDAFFDSAGVNNGIVKISLDHRKA